MAENPLTLHLWDSSGQITSTGSANAYVIATAEPITGYYQGMPPIRFKANFTNSGSATVNVNGLGAVTLKKEGGATNLASGNIVSGGIYTLSHDGTNFQVLELNSIIPAAAVDGVSNGLRWNFDSSTAMADPGTGDFRLNNATLASVTAIAVSDLTGETSNPDASPWVLAWDDSTNTVRGTLVVKKRGAEQNFAVYNITGASTDNSGWTQLAVTHVVSSGSFTNADACELTFSRAGNVGATGAGGVTSVVIQVFSATGTYTPTTGMLYCIAEVQAPGGGGGGGDSNNAAPTPPSNAGGGGGGGEYARGVFSAATIGASQAVTIGAVGTAGTTAGSDGGAGGATSLGALLTANGGSGGVGTGSNSASRVARAGGAGGTGGSGGAFRVPGGAGSAGFGYCTVPTSGSEAYSVVIGQGGSGVLGKPSAQGTGADITGSAGQNYGSGGNGGADDDTTGSAGGAGGPGIIVITEYVA